MNTENQSHAERRLRWQSLVFAFVISLLLTQWANAQDTKPLTTEELASHTIHRRVVDAVIWGLQLVGEDAVKQAAFRDGKANYNDILWWPKRGRLEEPVAHAQRQHK